MIRVQDVRKCYGGPDCRVEILSGVSLEIPQGEFLAVMGPSGCGKSTLLHLLGGLDQADSGRIFLGRNPLHEMNDQQLTRLRRDTIGIIFQFFNLLPTLTAQENIQLPALLQGKSSREVSTRSVQLLAEVGLSECADKKIHQLSGGEMQRVALARALIGNPAILLADEPTGNLDSESSRIVIALLHQLGREHGTTIVMVTHSAEIAAAADRCIVMRDGHILGPDHEGTAFPCS